MELGEKLLQARLEAGLSQRQLCGEVITRNMLSQIEHGGARPSMDTLRYLASRLGKPVSYFLDEDALSSANQQRMVAARQAYAEQDYAKVRNVLLAFQLPDPVFDWERKYRMLTSTLELARQAAARKAFAYARQLLEEAEALEQEFPELKRQRLLLQGKLPGADLTEIAQALPSQDEELLLRAEAALTQSETETAQKLLSAVQDREDPHWNLLWGRTLMLDGRYAQAAACLVKAEERSPGEVLPLLELCFRELGDYRKAYEYACRQR